MNRQKIFIAMVILWMIVIFAFSSRPGDLSSEDSYRAGMLVGRVLVPGFASWSVEEQEAYARKIDHPVRKIAHGTEYAILAVLWLLVLGRRRGMLSWGLATMYAVTDEFHQLFVPGRSGQITDVMIDSAGALVGCVCVMIELWLVRNIRKAEA